MSANDPQLLAKHVRKISRYEGITEGQASVLRSAADALEAALSSHPDEETKRAEVVITARQSGKSAQMVEMLLAIAAERGLDIRVIEPEPDEETVTTVEELDALPVGSLVLADGEVYQRITPNSRVNSGRETWRCLHEAKGYREWETYVALVVMAQEFRDGQGIARVLFRPTPEGSGS